MNLFFYYAFHSVVNQLRKLFKSWVIGFILVCGLIGGLVGAGAATLSDMETPEEETVEVAEDPMEDVISVFSEIDKNSLIELAASGLILIVCVTQIIGAEKNGSKIFLPADVNLLFPSPMQPQSVLMFRLGTRLGTSLAAGIYLLFQLPNLILNLHMPAPAAFAMLAVWMLMAFLASLLQTLVYTVTATRPALRKLIRPVVYSTLALIALAFGIYAFVSGDPWLVAADRFFNSGIARAIPFWGWLKGIFASACTGNTAALLIYTILVIAGMAGLVWVIYHTEADFYEDAMARSEEVAAIYEQMTSENNSPFAMNIRRKKDRSDSLDRDGMKYGRGASVFFFKTIYNRFRFAKARYFTKTTITYMITASALALFLRIIVKTDSIIPVALVLGAMVFFRSMGNPLMQDTNSTSFHMIPESTWKKLFWSELGGSLNCLLDVLPAIIIAAIILGSSIFLSLVWIILIVSVDFYATSAGTFIDLSLPHSIGTTIRQMFLVMFIYFGLLPDIAVFAVGMIMKNTGIAAVLVTLINLFLGGIFLGLTPVFTGPYSGRPIEKDHHTDIPAARSVFAKTGFIYAAAMFIVPVLQYGLIVLTKRFAPQLSDVQWYVWLINFLPLYIAAVPLIILLTKKIPAFPPQKKSLAKKYYLIIPVICIFMLYAGSITSNVVISLITKLFHIVPDAPVDDFTVNTPVLLRFIYMVIMAPLVEEFLFRKILIDRLHIYGGALSVFISAMMFGLFHGNFSQMFYAFTLGLVFGAVYLKTGKLHYTIILHMMINFLGGIIGPALLSDFSTAMDTLVNTPAMA